MHGDFSKRKTPYSTIAHRKQFFIAKIGKENFYVQKTQKMSNALPPSFLQKKETLLRMKQIRKTLFLENNSTVVESLCMAILQTKDVVQHDCSSKTIFHSQ